MKKTDPILWGFAVAVPGLAQIQLVAAAWSSMRKAGIAAPGLLNSPVWAVLGKLHSLENLGITLSCCIFLELLQMVLLK